MKEATGELNMTVITVVAIAAVAGIFYAFVWPAIKTNILNTQKCASAVCNCADSAETCTCHYTDDSGSDATVVCPMKKKK